MVHLGLTVLGSYLTDTNRSLSRRFFGISNLPLGKGDSSSDNEYRVAVLSYLALALIERLKVIQPLPDGFQQERSQPELLDGRLSEWFGTIAKSIPWRNPLGSSQIAFNGLASVLSASHLFKGLQRLFTGHRLLLCHSLLVRLAAA